MEIHGISFKEQMDKRQLMCDSQHKDSAVSGQHFIKVRLTAAVLYYCSHTGDRQEVQVDQVSPWEERTCIS